LPAAPHAPLAVPGWHAPLAAQQPSGQVLGSQGPHTPPVHATLPPQLTHDAPPDPHAEPAFPASQAVPSQQPSGQDVALQPDWHWFFTHSCPETHVGQVIDVHVSPPTPSSPQNESQSA